MAEELLGNSDDFSMFEFPKEKKTTERAVEQ